MCAHSADVHTSGRELPGVEELSCGSKRRDQGPRAGKLYPMWFSFTDCMTHPLAPHDSIYMGAQRSSQRGWGRLLAQPKPASLSSQDEHFIPLLAQSRSWHPGAQGWGKASGLGG